MKLTFDLDIAPSDLLHLAAKNAVEKAKHKVNKEDHIKQNVPAMGMVAEIELERNQVVANAKAEEVERPIKERPIISFGGDSDDSFVEDYALSQDVVMICDLRDRLSLEDSTI
jgi:hypothetical protein